MTQYLPGPTRSGIGGRGVPSARPRTTRTLQRLIHHPPPPFPGPHRRASVSSTPLHVLPPPVLPSAQTTRGVFHPPPPPSPRRRLDRRASVSAARVSTCRPRRSLLRVRVALLPPLPSSCRNMKIRGDFSHKGVFTGVFTRGRGVLYFILVLVSEERYAQHRQADRRGELAQS